MSVQVAKFTAAQYERMGEAGIFPPDYRAELIDGEIIEMSPIGNRHAACVDALGEQLREKLGRSAIIRVQNPIRLDDHSEPLPDVAVLKRREDFYRDGHPTPDDVLLVVEVSDTTLDYDCRTKVPLYARAGVPEVWIVNLTDERIETYADVTGGAYRQIGNAGRGDEVRARGVANLCLSVAEVLG